eukprot:6190775-Pleurochrysis_carterae.AAC.1
MGGSLPAPYFAECDLYAAWIALYWTYKAISHRHTHAFTAQKMASTSWRKLTPPCRCLCSPLSGKAHTATKRTTARIAGTFMAPRAAATLHAFDS